MKFRLLLALSAIVLFSSPVFSQESAFSAIRGRVLDRQSQFPLPGVSVILLGSEPLRGVATDPDGYFVLDKVPVGRQSIQVSFIGYEPRVFSNLLVFSGKELEVNVELEESVAMLEAVDVVAEEVKYEARNEMSTVSSRSFSVEEAMRYSGSLQDPARMAQNYAGVSNASDDRNDIIIRGNSPSGVLWRLEGIDIPSPNHFSSFGTTGGPVSMLNINNLANSDFITGAFAPEYGNALAGVFDLKLRSGNINKHEFLGQIGFNGFEFGAEGPIKIGNNASFLANYRYSTLEVFNALGLEFGTGSAVPQYQDLTFKVDIPTETAGRFTVFGIGGKSFIEFEASDATGQNLYSSDAENSQFGSDTYVAGFTHMYFFNEKWRSNFVVAASYAQTEGYVDSLSVEDASPVRSFGTNNVQSKYSANYSLNYKANSRNTFRAGVIADYYDVDIRDSVRTANGSFFSITDSRGETTLFQGHINWQHRWGERLTSNAGLHSQFLALNNSVVLEPRAGLRYKAGPRSTFSLAGGFHSQMQPLPVYFTRQRFEDGTSLLKNDRLDFNRSLHLVAGHDFLLNEQFRLKTEVYYQRLSNVAVDRDSSSFSILNVGADFTMPENGDLVNEGSGYNYGFEFTAERFFHKGLYFLTTLSLFESRYSGSDGVERNTAFNGNYVVNLLGGKEFAVGKSNALSFDSRLTYAGGRRYTPIDLDASIAEGRTIREEGEIFEAQYDAYFRLDLKVTYRMNREKWAQQFSIDFRNITNRENIFMETFNARNNEIETRYQIGFFPDVQYRVYF